MTSLNPDWLAALAIVRRVVPDQDIRAVFNHTTLQIGFQPVAVYLVEKFNKEDAEVICTRQKFETLAKIERVEILTYYALGLWYEFNNGTSPFTGSGILYANLSDEFQRLCFRAGCWHTNTPDIRERWRLIDFYSPAHMLPSAPYEDRPLCKLCKQPVATGAGAWVKSTVNSDSPMQSPGQTEIADALELKAWQALSSDERAYQAKLLQPMFYYDKAVHEECMRYAHRVLVPARLAQIAEEKRKAVAEVDR